MINVQNISNISRSKKYIIKVTIDNLVIQFDREESMTKLIMFSCDKIYEIYKRI